MNRFCLLLAGLAVFGLGGKAAPAQQSDDHVVARASAGPCRMTVSGGPQIFTVQVAGLAPGESLRIESNSEGELMRSNSEASADGRYVSVLFPLVKGKSFGSATFTITGTRCRIEASYPWRED